LLLDLRYAWRSLLRAPLVTGMAILCIGLGIGSVTTIFSTASAFTFHPLPQLKDASRLVVVGESPTSDPARSRGMSAGAYLDLRGLPDVFSDVTAILGLDVNIVGTDEAERVQAARVPVNFFRAMGRAPLAGRAFGEGDEAPGGEPVIILGHGLWQRRFGGDKTLLGRAVRINGEPHTVVGIMPEDFTFPGVQAWIPLALGAESASVRQPRDLFVMARLAPGVAPERAAAAVATLGQRMAVAHPETSTGWVWGIQPAERWMGQGPRPFILVLLGSAACVLLIACANVANLLLARANTRRREVGVRVALGASRGRIVRQMLTESLLIALLGGTLGVLFAFWGLNAMTAMIPAEMHARIPGFAAIGLDGRALVFTIAIALSSGIVFGFVPALSASRTDVSQALKEAGRDPAGSRSRLLRDGLVVAEVAMALMLIVGASLMAVSGRRLLLTDPGFRVPGVLTLATTLPEADYPENKAVVAFYDNLSERISALPGVEDAGLSTILPLSWSNESTSVEVEGRPPHRPEDAPVLGLRIVSSAYLRTLCVPMLSGRGLSPQDGPDSPPVGLISEAAASRLWPDLAGGSARPRGGGFRGGRSEQSEQAVPPGTISAESPMGRRLRVRERWIEVVGVVGNVRGNTLGDRDPLPVLYLSCRQWPERSMTVVVRGPGDPARLAPAIRRLIAGLDGRLAAGDVSPMPHVIAVALYPQLGSARTMTVAAVIALVLAALGIYGVMAYSVAQRTHEIGIRIALGATYRGVLRLVLGHAAFLAMTGITLGIAGAVAMGFGMRAILFETSPTDPWIIGGAALFLLTVALLAAYFPARRAARTDPMNALRSE